MTIKELAELRDRMEKFIYDPSDMMAAILAIDELIDIRKRLAEMIKDEHGRDGYCTVQINSVADETMELIKHLQLELGMMTISRDGLKTRLESCEKALEERDSKNG